MLEPLTAAHADALFPVLGDARVWRHIGGSAGSDGTTLAQMRAGYARRARGSGRAGETWWNLAVRLRDGTCIGRLEATVMDDGWAEIAYLLGVDFHGRGLGREAVAWLLAALPVDEAWATVHPENGPSRRLLEALGFEGVAPSRPLASWDPGDLAWRRLRR